jgi:hypothetical protein
MEPASHHNGVPMRDPYGHLDGELNRLAATATGFGMLVRTSQYELPPSTFMMLHERYKTIRAFQLEAIDLFYRSVRGEIAPEWGKRLLGDVPAELGREFHLALPANLRKPPVFFRSDEVGPGKITEIQCPGSGWGEFCLLEDFYRGGHLANSFAQRWTDALNAQFDGPKIVHHLIDNASMPPCNHFFINCTRTVENAPKYWPFDKGIRPTDCNFIRTHLFSGMMYENFAASRLERGKRGELFYDYPPMAIFEQKLLYVLPFDPQTKDAFGDEVRALFPYSAILTDSGFWDEDGQFVLYEEFIQRPRGDRDFFIKYGGVDPNINWGSRGVFHAGDFSQNRLRALVGAIRRDNANGRHWVIQRSIGSKESCKFYSRVGDVEACTVYTKFSAFYGPTGLLGVNSKHRTKRKVHGASDTIASICAPSAMED